MESTARRTFILTHLILPFVVALSTSIVGLIVGRRLENKHRLEVEIRIPDPSASDANLVPAGIMHIVELRNAGDYTEENVHMVVQLTADHAFELLEPVLEYVENSVLFEEVGVEQVKDEPDGKFFDVTAPLLHSEETISLLFELSTAVTVMVDARSNATAVDAYLPPPSETTT